MEATLPIAPTHTIAVRSDLYDTLLRIAVREGKNVDTVADEILTRTMHRDGAATRTSETFMEILEPLQNDFDASGMTDDELADFIAEEIAAHRKEQALNGA